MRRDSWRSKRRRRRRRVDGDGWKMLLFFFAVLNWPATNTTTTQIQTRAKLENEEWSNFPPFSLLGGRRRSMKMAWNGSSLNTGVPTSHRSTSPCQMTSIFTTTVRGAEKVWWNWTINLWFKLKWKQRQRIKRVVVKCKAPPSDKTFTFLYYMLYISLYYITSTENSDVLAAGLHK